MVDNSGNVLLSESYDAFGQTATGLTSGFEFQGMLWDEAVGMYDDSARFEDASMERFTSKDPTGLVADLNPYRFVANGPTNGTDPSGLKLFAADKKSAQMIGYWLSDESPSVNINISEPKANIGGSLLVPGANEADVIGQLEMWRKRGPQSQGDFRNLMVRALTAINSNEINEEVYTDKKGNVGIRKFSINPVASLFDYINPTARVNAGFCIDVGKKLASQGFLCLDGNSISQFSPDVVNLVRLGMKQYWKEKDQLKRGLVPDTAGYRDAFGSHKSFCLSCHAPNDQGALLKYQAAYETTGFER